MTKLRVNRPRARRGAPPCGLSAEPPPRRVEAGVAPGGRGRRAGAAQPGADQAARLAGTGGGLHVTRTRSGSCCRSTARAGHRGAAGLAVHRAEQGHLGLGPVAVERVAWPGRRRGRRRRPPRPAGRRRRPRPAPEARAGRRRRPRSASPDRPPPPGGPPWAPAARRRRGWPSGRRRRRPARTPGGTGRSLTQASRQAQPCAVQIR